LVEIARATGAPHLVCTSEKSPLPCLAPELSSLLCDRLELLPLRERREDLGMLIGAALFAADSGFEWGVEPEAARVLFGHEWSGNLRELHELVTSAAAQADDGLLRLEHLPEALQRARSTAGGEEAQTLSALLAEHGGNVSAVARALGRGRSYVRRAIARLALDPRSYRRSPDKEEAQ
jgi:transcriptional regulator of acetoin/glycerol metabolism